MTNPDASAASVQRAAHGPVGVRMAQPDVAGGVRRLRWVVPGPTSLTLGERVVVRDGAGTWVGEVVIPAERLLEWPPPDRLQDLPTVERCAEADEWPLAVETAGYRLLASLGLSEDARRRLT